MIRFWLEPLDARGGPRMTPLTERVLQALPATPLELVALTRETSKTINATLWNLQRAGRARKSGRVVETDLGRRRSALWEAI